MLSAVCQWALMVQLPASRYWKDRYWKDICFCTSVQPVMLPSVDSHGERYTKSWTSSRSMSKVALFSDDAPECVGEL